MSSYNAIYIITTEILQKITPRLTFCVYFFTSFCVFYMFRTVHTWNLGHWPTFNCNNNQVTVRLLHLDHFINSRKAYSVCSRQVQWSTFLSSSAEFHKAESAPRCAKLSLERAMSDNSNSTGSSGSSTNSWTLLSPEVSQRNRLSKLCLKLCMPECILEECYLSCSRHRISFKIELTANVKYQKVVEEVLRAFI